MISRCLLLSIHRSWARFRCSSGTESTLPLPYLTLFHTSDGGSWKLRTRSFTRTLSEHSGTVRYTEASLYPSIYGVRHM
ncbi:hypothetical protein F5B21DRAFT_495744 [Xylaria acuta]|nr:hypothetical protein F5B21DRAFT_495744 [Xylaria acuta]